MADTKVRVETAPAGAERGDCLLIPLCEGASLEGALADIDRAAGGAVAAVLERGDFRGRKDEVLPVYPAAQAPASRLVLIGAGKRDAFGRDSLRRAVGNGVRQAERLGVASIAVPMAHVASLMPDAGAAAHVVAEAAVLAAWDYRDLKTVVEDPPRTVVGEVTLFAADAESARAIETGVASGRITASAANVARGLAIRPGNVATPEFLAATAREIAGRFEMECTVLDRADLEREGMHALLAVAAGSEQEPRFIILEYQGGTEGDAPLVLIGKGVTFDAGGISIKPAERMEEMKYDMSGGAAVLGAMQGIAELALPLNVVALVPATENLPSGSAVKPGDIIGSHLGKTIEVINTDAEGRLILVDALSWARRYEPAAIVDAATLTGAIVVALGHHAIGLMGNDDGLVDEVRQAGETVGERCWPMPLWDAYREQLDSPVADIRNTGGRAAGSLTAGWFLREFAGTAPWAHLDVAGTAWRDDAMPWLRKGPTGVPTRIFIEWVRSRART
ncbi:MAG: leucyl aminopeptidase [Gemmatimonadota bacterium]|jgi:leucyl aminopeptidase